MDRNRKRDLAKILLDKRKEYGDQARELIKLSMQNEIKTFSRKGTIIKDPTSIGIVNKSSTIRDGSI